MNEIEIVCNYGPSKGMGVAKQKCTLIRTNEGFLATELKWEGSFFGKKKETFIFPNDTIQLSRLTDSEASASIRMTAFSKASPFGHSLGLIGRLAAGAIGAAVAKTSSLKGFRVAYMNEQQSKGEFEAVTSSEVLEEICASIPKDKVKGLPTVT